MYYSDMNPASHPDVKIGYIPEFVAQAGRMGCIYERI
jgi:hypothetical protein